MDFVISAVVAYFLYLLFEAPAQRLNELFCSGSTNESENSVSTTNTYADSNRAYIFDGQTLQNKSNIEQNRGVTSVGDHYNHHHRYNHQSSTNSAQQKSQALTHRSKTTADDEFTDGTIISIRF